MKMGLGEKGVRAEMNRNQTFYENHLIIKLYNDAFEMDMKVSYMWNVNDNVNCPHEFSISNLTEHKQQPLTESKNEVHRKIKSSARQERGVLSAFSLYTRNNSYTYRLLMFLVSFALFIFFYWNIFPLFVCMARL